jgi:hypothetical protein
MEELARKVRSERERERGESSWFLTLVTEIAPNILWLFTFVLVFNGCGFGISEALYGYIAERMVDFVA